jgi:hypothetical protein
MGLRGPRAKNFPRPRRPGERQVEHPVDEAARRREERNKKQRQRRWLGPRPTLPRL